MLSYSSDRNIGRIFKKITHLTSRICQLCEAGGSSRGEEAEEFLGDGRGDAGGGQEGQAQKKKLQFNSSESHFHK